MNHLSVTKQIIAVMLLLSCGISHAADNLYVFVFKEGAAQKNITVSVGEKRAQTNEFGLASFTLPADSYEVGYYKNDKLFALTEINLLAEQQSQIFLMLTKDGAEVDLDLPLAAYQQSFDHQQVKSQEGPKGTLKFKLLDNKSGAVVAGAKLFFKGYAVEANSDENGIVSIELSEGLYDISVIHPKYIMRVLRDIELKADATTEQAVKLSRADIVMEEFVVSAPSVEGSMAATLMDLKESSMFADAISSEQFSKSGDSSASSALQRLPGVTVVDGKYVFIRGLGERYSTVLLNDLHVPTPEPTKRVVPLDVFPTDVIEEMIVQKSYSSDLPGTFAGGTVMINSNGIPKEDNYIKGGVSLAFHDSTGENVIYNPDNASGVPNLLLQHSDNFSPLSEEVVIPSTGQVLAEGLSAEEKLTLNTAMINYRRYGLTERKLEPGKKLAFSLGQSFKSSGGLKYGITGSLYYQTKEKSIERFEEIYDEANVHEESGRDQITELNEKFGGLVTLGMDTMAGHQLQYTLLTLNESNDLTKFGDFEMLLDEDYGRKVLLQYTEEQLTAHQFNGEHHFGRSSGGYFDDVQINWGIETASATRLEPGTFEYEYKEVNDELVLNAKKYFYLYSDLDDQVENLRLDFTLPFQFNEQDNFTKFGLFSYQKSRGLDNRRFKIEYTGNDVAGPIDELLIEDNVQNGSIDVLDAYRPADFYTAEQEVTALYFNQLISPLEQVDLVFGVRQESSSQSLQVGAEKTTYQQETSDILPSLASTWRINNEHQLRFSYSNTLSRPDFREFSPNRYKDPVTDNIVFGYEDLRYTTITNIDMTYEWYPSYDEYLTLALFSKDFIDPIETVRSRTDEDIENTFRNAKSATSVGFEVGFRKNLDRLFSNLKHYYVASNYAYIDSTINLDKDAPENIGDPFIEDLTSDTRPMQGQSPYVINFQLGYDNFFTRRSAVLLYNIMGERISELGINGLPDIYEQPFGKLDFVVKWGLNDTYDDQSKKIGYQLSFKASNLLNDEVVFKQGENVTSRYKPGRFYTISFSMKY